MEKAIIVYLESVDGQIVKVSLEALNAAKQYAAKSGKGVSAVLIGAADAAAAAQNLRERALRYRDFVSGRPVCPRGQRMHGSGDKAGVVDSR